jgi:cysteine desulfurase
VITAVTESMREGAADPHGPGAASAEARRAVERAAERVLAMAGRRGGRVVFTSGATEANNLAVFGLAASDRGARRRIVLCPTEHPSVLEPCRAAARAGLVELTMLPVDGLGRVAPADLDAALGDDVALVSLMWVNHVTGFAQDLGPLLRSAKRAGALTHVDASQGVARMGRSLADVDADLISISGHKMGAPAGVGALVVRDGVNLAARVLGDTHQGGLRAGPVPVALAVGLGVAAEIARTERTTRACRLRVLADELRDALEEEVGGCRFVCPPNVAAPGILALSIEGIDSNDLVALSDDVTAAAGSSCERGHRRVEPVLEAIGLPTRLVPGFVRLSVCPRTTRGDLRVAAWRLGTLVSRLRGLESATVSELSA